MTAGGGVTLDGDKLLADAVACLADALAAKPDAPIAAVAVCTFWHSALAVDARGDALTPILLWSDRRSFMQVETLRSELDATAYTERTGCPLHTSYLPGKLLYLAQTDADLFARCDRFLSPGEYLFCRWFGRERVTQSFSMASGTGLWDAHAEAWDGEMLSWLPGMSAARLSPVSDEPVHGLLSPYREQLPRLADVPFYPALGDGACSNLGAGGVTPDKIVLMIGTSGALRVAVSGATPPPVPPGLWRYRADKDRYLIGGALSNGGNVWAWLEDTIRLPDTPRDATEAALDALPPDGHRLTVLPFLAGERAPLWRDKLTATISGLTQATTPLEIARAAMESVAYRFAAVRERLLSVAPRAEIIGTGGGLLHSPAWARILADVLGEPIVLSAEGEGSSHGVALWVRERLGYGRVDEVSFALGQRFEPNPATRAVYAAARERHEALLSRLG